MAQETPADTGLAALNSATLGTTMPMVVLPDGQRVPTGTVGALIINIRLYDQMMCGPDVGIHWKSELETRMAASVPVLNKAGKYLDVN